MEKLKMYRLFAIVFLASLFPAALAQGAEGELQKVTIPLSSAQLRHLKASPVQLVPAPGIGKLLNLVSAVAQYKAGGSPFTVANGGDFALSLGAAEINITLPSIGFLDQAGNQVRMNGGSHGGPQSGLENQPLAISNDGSAEWSDGDGSVIVTVYYTVVDLQ